MEGKVVNDTEVLKDVPIYNDIDLHNTVLYLRKSSGKSKLPMKVI